MIVWVDFLPGGRTVSESSCCPSLLEFASAALTLAVPGKCAAGRRRDQHQNGATSNRARRPTSTPRRPRHSNTTSTTTPQPTPKQHTKHPTSTRPSATNATSANTQAPSIKQQPATARSSTQRWPATTNSKGQHAVVSSSKQQPTPGSREGATQGNCNRHNHHRAHVMQPLLHLIAGARHQIGPCLDTVFSTGRRPTCSIFCRGAPATCRRLMLSGAAFGPGHCPSGRRGGGGSAGGTGINWFSVLATGGGGLRVDPPFPQEASNHTEHSFWPCGPQHRIPSPSPPLSAPVHGERSKGYATPRLVYIQNAPNETGNSKSPRKTRKNRPSPPSCGAPCPRRGGWGPELNPPPRCGFGLYGSTPPPRLGDRWRIKHNFVGQSELSGPLLTIAAQSPDGIHSPAGADGLHSQLFPDQKIALTWRWTLVALHVT